jgi:hypothetical protein
MIHISPFNQYEPIVTLSLSGLRPRSHRKPVRRSCSLGTAVDPIANCDGDARRAALRASLVYNDFLERKLDTNGRHGLGGLHARGDFARS